MEVIKNIKKTHKIAIAIILLTVLWMYSGVFNSTEKSKDESIASMQAKAKTNIQSVRVQKIVSENMMSNVSITGKTESYRTVNMRAETPGRVKTINLEKGNTVKKGETIISLAVDSRESLYNKAKSNLETKKINYNAKLKLQAKELTSNAAVSKAKSDLEQASADLEIAKLNLEHTKIKAPFDGIIEDRYVEIGDFINIGQSVIKIIDLNPIKAVGYLSENIRHSIKTGNKATVVLPNGEVEGKITYLSSSANAATRTYKFEVEIQNNDNTVTEGLTCKIKVDAGSIRAHNISPSLIVLNDKGILGIRVIDENNIVKFLPANFITDENEKIWLSGLPEEFTIITVGHEFVKDGVKVSPIYKEAK